jgi:hypothetical protein
MSIQKMARQPVMLIDMEFNIPLFNADTQMYVCTDVSEIASSPGGKDYTISFSEIKQKYAVPERINIDMFIPTDGNGGLAHVTMNEIRTNGRDIKLAQTLTPKENITTLEGLKKIFYQMAKKM